MSKLLKALQNPFVLVGQGFVIGAAIFLSTHEPPRDPNAQRPTADASFVDRIKAYL